MDTRRFLLIGFLAFLFIASLLVKKPISENAQALVANASSVTIYDELLAPEWANWSWNSSVAFDAADTVASGSKAIKVITYPWGALYLHTDTIINANTYEILQFSARASEDDPNFSIHLYNANNQPMNYSVPLTKYTTLSKDTWQIIQIPLSDLNPHNQDIKGIVIQEVAGKTQQPLYIDDVKFITNKSVSSDLSNDLVIYHDGLQQNWENWSWGGAINTTASDIVQSGTKSIAFTPSPWSAFYLHTNGNIDTSPYTTLRFAIYATGDNQSFSLITYGQQDNQLIPGNPLKNYGGAPTKNAWKEYAIPLADLKAANTIIKGVALQETTGKQQPLIYIDNIRLTTNNSVNTSIINKEKSVQTTPVVSPTVVITPTVTPTVQSVVPAQGSSSSLGGIQFYVHPENNAKKTADAWRAAGRTTDADTMMKIANSPWAVWAVDNNAITKVSEYVSQSNNAGAVAVLVVYNIPGRDCGQYSHGGSTYEGYKSWISSIASAIGDKKAIVVLEPDALGLDCLQNENTYSLLRFAVDTLEAKANTNVYIEASTWVSPDIMAERLNKVGISKAQGFAINVSGYNTTESMISYGNSVSSKVGGKHFIIDTSRNGNGPYEASESELWCNPPGRALGPRPTTNTGHANVDAFFWIKVPGESDGTCRGGPSAGQWWPDYALGLAQRASY